MVLSIDCPRASLLVSGSFRYRGYLPFGSVNPSISLLERSSNNAACFAGGKSLISSLVYVLVSSAAGLLVESTATLAPRKYS